MLKNLGLGDSMKSRILLVSALILLSSIAKAGQPDLSSSPDPAPKFEFKEEFPQTPTPKIIDCRWNTYVGIPTISIYGLTQSTPWSRVRKWIRVRQPDAFSSYPDRNEALEKCFAIEKDWEIVVCSTNVDMYGELHGHPQYCGHNKKTNQYVNNSNNQPQHFESYDAAFEGIARDIKTTYFQLERDKPVRFQIIECTPFAYQNNPYVLVYQTDSETPVMQSIKLDNKELQQSALETCKKIKNDWAISSHNSTVSIIFHNDERFVVTNNGDDKTPKMQPEAFVIEKIIEQITSQLAGDQSSNDKTPIDL
jgi:hypothetical protein